MPKNEDGEFELILGNRQVLSVFFIFVILLGVFFTVGYAVGRGSAPIVAATARPDSKPDVADTVVSRPPDIKPEPHAEVVAKQPTSTAPQQPAEQPKAVKETPKEVEPPKQEKASKADAAKPTRAIVEPETGQTYLQLSATRRAEAETYVDVLKKKGFTAMAAEVPENHDLFRVLVGPLPDSGINKARTDLQAAGFPGDKALRKKF